MTIEKAHVRHFSPRGMSRKKKKNKHEAMVTWGVQGFHPKEKFFRHYDAKFSVHNMYQWGIQGGKEAKGKWKSSKEPGTHNIKVGLRRSVNDLKRESLGGKRGSRRATPFIRKGYPLWCTGLE